MREKQRAKEHSTLGCKRIYISKLMQTNNRIRKEIRKKLKKSDESF